MMLKSLCCLALDVWPVIMFLCYELELKRRLRGGIVHQRFRSWDSFVMLKNLSRDEFGSILLSRLGRFTRSSHREPSIIISQFDYDGSTGNICNNKILLYFVKPRYLAPSQLQIDAFLSKS